MTPGRSREQLGHRLVIVVERTFEFQDIDLQFALVFVAIDHVQAVSRARWHLERRAGPRLPRYDQDSAALFGFPTQRLHHRNAILDETTVVHQQRAQPKYHARARESKIMI